MRLIMSEMMAKYQAHHGKLDFVKLCLNGVLRVGVYAQGDYLSYVDAQRLGVTLPQRCAQAIWVIEYPLTPEGLPADDSRYCVIIEPHFSGWREADSLGQESDSLESTSGGQESGHEV